MTDPFSVTGLAIRAGREIISAATKIDNAVSVVEGAVETVEAAQNGDVVGAVKSGVQTTLGVKSSAPGNKSSQQTSEQTSNLVENTTDAAKKPNLNRNDATSNFGLYEIETPVGLEKVGKADLNRVTQSSGLPTGLHQQVRKLEKVHGQGSVKGTVVEDLGETTTAAAKAAEKSRVKKIVDETGQVPPGNEKSYKP